MSSNPCWKQIERRVAVDFGGKRVPVHSTNGVKCDVVTDNACIQVKERISLPVFIKDVIAQAQADCTDGKLPIVVLHEKGKDRKSDIVLMPYQDYLDWYV